MQRRMRPAKLALWVAGGLVAVAVVLAGLGYGLARPTADVRSPSPESSPERVVQVELRVTQSGGDFVEGERASRHLLLVRDDDAEAWQLVDEGLG